MSLDFCNIVKYPTSWGFRREPARPVELRKDYFNGMKFDENFDWDNLWYDAVQINQNCIVLIGPPLYNRRNLIRQHCQFISNGEVDKIQTFDMDRASLTVLDVSNWCNEILLNPGNTVIPVNNISNEFSEKICLMTLQKNNPISWIKQWILYHKNNFGVDGVLIYDNNSTDYSIEELERSIQVAGVTVKIVAWNVPYGPQGFDCDYYNTWDSDYAQSTMFEHAKRRYVHNARLAINCDIDELLVLPTNTSLDSITSDIIKEQVTGYCYKGRWIEPVDITTSTLASSIQLEDRKFENYYCTDPRNSIGIGNKWMIIPHLALQYQWLVHHTGAPMKQNDNIWYGHYMPMNTNWSWNRDNYNRDLSGLKPEVQLQQNLSKIGKF